MNGRTSERLIYLFSPSRGMGEGNRGNYKALNAYLECLIDVKERSGGEYRPCVSGVRDFVKKVTEL